MKYIASMSGEDSYGSSITEHMVEINGKNEKITYGGKYTAELYRFRGVKVRHTLSVDDVDNDTHLATIVLAVEVVKLIEEQGEKA